MIYHSGAKAMLSRILRDGDEQMIAKCAKLLWETAQNQIGEDKLLFEFMLGVFLRAQHFVRTQFSEFAHPPWSLAPFRMCECEQKCDQLMDYLRARRERANLEHTFREWRSRSPAAVRRTECPAPPRSKQKLSAARPPRCAATEKKVVCISETQLRRSVDKSHALGLALRAAEIAFGKVLVAARAGSRASCCGWASALRGADRSRASRCGWAGELRAANRSRASRCGCFLRENFGDRSCEDLGRPSCCRVFTCL